MLAIVLRNLGRPAPADALEFALVFMLLPHGLAPLTALLYAAGVVTDEVEEQTLTYLLLRSVPRVDEARKDRLVSIRGLPPDLTNPPPGCKFHPRCPFVIDRCRVEEPSLGEVALNQVARCWVLMRNVKEDDVAAAKASALSIEAAQKLKADAEAAAAEVDSVAGS